MIEHVSRDFISSSSSSFHVFSRRDFIPVFECIIILSNRGKIQCKHSFGLSTSYGSSLPPIEKKGYIYSFLIPNKLLDPVFFFLIKVV